MTNSKLKESDFDSIHFGNDSGGPERHMITIDDIKSKSHCNQIRNNVASATVSERRFLTQEMTSSS